MDHCPKCKATPDEGFISTDSMTGGLRTLCGDSSYCLNCGWDEAEDGTEEWEIEE